MAAEAESLQQMSSLSHEQSNNQSRKQKKHITDYFSPRNKDKKDMVSKMVQVNLDVSHGPCLDLSSKKFWNLLAEYRRTELEKALQENEHLYKLREALIKKNVFYKQKLEEANIFVDLFKEVVQDTADDTGIDVGDINDSTEK